MKFLQCEDEELAQEFLERFCEINGIDISDLPIIEGALQIKQTTGTSMCKNKFHLSILKYLVDIWLHLGYLFKSTGFNRTSSGETFFNPNEDSIFFINSSTKLKGQLLFRNILQQSSYEMQVS